MKKNAFSKNMGWIEIICGPMFAGKTEELLRRLKRLEYADVNSMLFKPKIDTRTKGKIRSRNGKEKFAFEFDNPFEIYKYILDSPERPHVIAIDEVQFASEEIIEVVETLAKKGFVIYLSGLDNDFKGEPFLITSKFLAIAEKIQKLTAICTECGAPGTMTQRIINDEPARYDSPLILVGNLESYTVKCRQHHKIKGKKKDEKTKEFEKSFNV